MKSLKHNLLAMFLPVALLGIVITAAWSVLIYFRQEHKQLEGQLRRGHQSVDLEMQSYADVMLHSTRAVIEHEDVTNVIKHSDRQALLAILQQLKSILAADSVELLNREGRVLAETQRLTRYGQDESYKSMFRAALAGIPQAGLAQSDLGLAIEVYFPVLDEGETIAVVEVVHLVGQRFLQLIKGKYGLESIVYDGDRLQATSFSDPRIILDPDLTLLKERAEGQKALVTKRFRHGGLSCYVSCRPILSRDRTVVGALLLSVTDDSVYQNLMLVGTSLVISVLMMGIIVVAICFRVASGLVRPINGLALLTRDISQGALDQRVTVCRNDEIGQLGAAFNDMTEKLSASTTSIENLNMEIAERKRVEEELKTANRELEAFAYTVSHDLRVPLTSIIGYADFLHESCRDRLDAQMLNCLAEIAASGEKMSALMEDLLTLAKVGQIESPVEPLDTRRIVSETLDNLSEQIFRSGGRVVVGELPALRAPKSLLAQVFDNLIGNALHYGCQPGGVVEVGGERNGERVRLYVRDHGPGIPAAERDRIFEIFFRGAAGRYQQGSGIGLATVQKIAKLYRGRAWMEETPGGGSTFWVELADLPVATEKE